MKFIFASKFKLGIFGGHLALDIFSSYIDVEKFPVHSHRATDNLHIIRDSFKIRNINLRTL